MKKNLKSYIGNKLIKLQKKRKKLFFLNYVILTINAKYDIIFFFRLGREEENILPLLYFYNY